jgi:hypothetical protein
MFYSFKSIDYIKNPTANSIAKYIVVHLSESCPDGKANFGRLVAGPVGILSADPAVTDPADTSCVVRVGRGGIVYDSVLGI